MFGPFKPIVWIPAVTLAISGFIASFVGVFVGNTSVGLGLGFGLIGLAILGGFFVLFIISDLPPIRWHILHVSRVVEFRNPDGSEKHYHETLRMRSLRSAIDEITYHVSHSGTFRVVKIEQDHVELPDSLATRPTLSFGYKVVDSDGGSQIHIQLHRSVRWGQSTLIEGCQMGAYRPQRWRCRRPSAGC